jgi:hypothetical protein
MIEHFINDIDVIYKYFNTDFRDFLYLFSN